ncbi:hypothetical protein SYK_30270 [Pseudodesulfovibrio nedwellii]|uniref:DUF4400 domain-containing protein n=1 Tax=Pseudodesulfovibrio nedwellii TaxID=2973072 RepID=A0ABN6S5W3_9BACT|nr:MULTISPECIES: hypothetical protein [Pseudodesulfovibrio]BDQ38667.1 hypothetical protein SYK_30270 [Pseudodesulfovibrio nedwellii]
MIHNKKEFYGGAGLLVAFFVVLFFMFQPLFNGHNAMEYLDNLYNSISKGSVEYAPALKKEFSKYASTDIDLTLNYDSEIEASQATALFLTAGVKTALQGKALHVNGSLGSILDATLTDCDTMYHNKGDVLQTKYNLEPRRIMFNWWTSLKLMDKELTDQGQFEAAKVINTIEKKGVEAAYNYFKIEPMHIMDNLGLVIFSLVFYVFYTLWYGFAILFVFEGWGLRLSH